MKTPFLYLLALLTILIPGAAWAISGSTYEISPDANLDSTHHSLTGSTYQLNGSIDPIAGEAEGSSFTLQSGDGFEYYCGDGFVDPGEDCDSGDLNGGSCSSEGYDSGTLTCSSTCSYVTSACESSSSGGTTSGGSVLTEDNSPGRPRLDGSLTLPTFTYQSDILLHGSVSANADEMLVNGQVAQDPFINPITWRLRAALGLGDNALNITARNQSGTSDPLVASVHRRMIGDVKEDGVVNDYDLSRLVRLWGSGNAEADFNVDGIVNDPDFSMLVARWGTQR